MIETTLMVAPASTCCFFATPLGVGLVGHCRHDPPEWLFIDLVLYAIHIEQVASVPYRPTCCWVRYS